MSDAIVKNLNFGLDAKDKVFKGIEKLTKAVSSTLGASGKCVILEDDTGRPLITKDGVTVANSIILLDPVENMGATLLKEAARQTVQEAGDGTTTATVLAHALLKQAYKEEYLPYRTKAINEYLDKELTPKDFVKKLSKNEKFRAQMGEKYPELNIGGSLVDFLKSAVPAAAIGSTAYSKLAKITGLD